MKLPRFSLRELFLLVLVCAVGAGWFVDHRRVDDIRSSATMWRRNALNLQHILEEHGWEVEWQKAKPTPVIVGLKTTLPPPAEGGLWSPGYDFRYTEDVESGLTSPPPE